VKILQISSAKHFGGGERHFVDLSRGLINQGHKIFVALRPTNEWQARLDFVPPENILHVSLRNSLGVLSAQKIAEFITEKNIEIVHAHAARDYIPASLACRIAKTPKFVLTRHVLFPLKPFYRFALGNLSRAIAVSSAVETNLQKIFPKEKIKLVLNGTDVEYLAQNTHANDKQNLQQNLQIASNTFLVGTVGELKSSKGQDLFLQGAALVVKKFPNVHFIVAGTDNFPQKIFEKQLIALVRQLEIIERVHFVGWIENVGALMRGLDIFVSAARTEPFGLVIIEAMASGTMVIATETEGASEILRDGETGKLIPLENSTRLAEAIVEILSDEKMREDFCRNAQAEAKLKFSLKRMIIETEKIYNEVLFTDKPE